MIYIFYVISIIFFCIGSFIVPLIFLPLILIVKSKERIIHPTDLLMLSTHISSTLILLFLIEYVWRQYGFDPGWIFPAIIAILHLVMGAAKGANLANQGQAYGVVFGVMFYGIVSLLT